MKDWRDPTEDIFEPIGDRRRHGWFTEWGCSVAVLAAITFGGAILYSRYLTIFAVYSVPALVSFCLLTLFGGLVIAFWPNRWHKTIRAMATIDHKYIERGGERIFGDATPSRRDTFVIHATLECETKVEALCTPEIYATIQERSTGLLIVRGNRLLAYMPRTQ